MMKHSPHKDKAFLSTLYRWLEERGEVLVFIEAVASSPDPCLFTTREQLQKKIEECSKFCIERLPTLSIYGIFAIKKYDFPLRGIMDEAFAKAALEIPEMKNTYPTITTNDEIFWKTLNQWFEEKGEILLLVWYPGSYPGYELELHQNLELLKQRIANIESGRLLSIIKDFHAPIRGKVDQEFISKALQYIEEHEAFIVLELEYEDLEKGSLPDFERGDNHVELVEMLKERTGTRIALGKDKDLTWKEGHIEELEAFVE